LFEEFPGTGKIVLGMCNVGKTAQSAGDTSGVLKFTPQSERFLKIDRGASVLRLTIRDVSCLVERLCP
jgi:hypothetical protein